MRLSFRCVQFSWSMARDMMNNGKNKNKNDSCNPDSGLYMDVEIIICEQ